MFFHKERTFRSWRWIAAWVQAFLILIIPFVKINGQSALRFDVPSLTLFFFGSVLWISEAYFFLLLFFLFLTAIMLFTVLFGRIWCGWMCPQTVLSDIAQAIERMAPWFTAHPLIRIVVNQFLFVLFAAFISVTLIWYFVSPYDMIESRMTPVLNPWAFWSWIFFTVLVYLDIAFVRRHFCASVCPYARFQSAFFDDRTLAIAFDQTQAAECRGCEACVQVCPTNIDIRKGSQVECINCAACIDACCAMMKKRNRGPLVRYMEVPGQKQGPRVRVIALAFLLAFFGLLLVHQAYVRMPFYFWVIRDEPQPFINAKQDGAIMNSYSLVMENRSLAQGFYELTIDGVNDGRLRMTPNPFILPPNRVTKMRVYVLMDQKNVKTGITQIRFVMHDTVQREISMEQQAPFFIPMNKRK